MKMVFAIGIYFHQHVKVMKLTRSFGIGKKMPAVKEQECFGPC